ncbi:MAG: hypothetical protein KGD70_00015 [Candidatus Lokiarchaeota archaeon]|nr:hypothetical protein [Candidatus Lokiarchaeota archaeon]
MATNKKTLGITILLIGIMLLIIGVIGVNTSSAEFDIIFIVGFLSPGILFLVVGMILLALHLHNVT